LNAASKLAIFLFSLSILRSITFISDNVSRSVELTTAFVSGATSNFSLFIKMLLVSLVYHHLNNSDATDNAYECFLRKLLNRSHLSNDHIAN
jgi:hypothetical protein